MRVTVLGKYGPYPAPEGACSGYFVEGGGARVLLDIGTGVLGRLQRFCRLEDLSCLILSHWHNDHASDLLPLRYAIESLQKRGIRQTPLRVVAPPVPDPFRALLGTDAFTFVESEDLLHMEIESLHVELHAMTHAVPSFAAKVHAQGKTFVYSGDTAFNGRFLTLALHADLLLCEAGILAAEESETAIHMSGQQCGQAAQVASVKSLLLTHIAPYVDPEQLLREAALHFESAAIAEELFTYQV